MSTTPTVTPNPVLLGHLVLIGFLTMIYNIYIYILVVYLLTYMHMFLCVYVYIYIYTY